MHSSHIPATRPPKKQRGIAILTVLVIATLVVTLATVILARQSRSLRQADNFQSLERAWQYAFTIEQYAALQLQLDAQENKYDALTDRWAQELPMQVLTEESGAIVRLSGKLEDMQGRLNLNNLVLQQQSRQQNPPQGQPPTQGNNPNSGFNNKTYTVLKNFIADAGLPPTFPDAIVDWIDSNNQPLGLGGAEQNYYLATNTPYLPANMPFADPSELRLLRLEIQEPERKEQLLGNLLSTVTTLPFYTTINPNTASENVLRALRLTDAQIDIIMNRRAARQAFTSQDNFVGEMRFNGQQFRELGLLDLFDVSSQYFRLTGEIEINRARVFLNSLLFRTANGQVHVIMRQFSRVNEATTTNTETDVSNTPANTNG